jgi:hypothetical protein
MICRKFITETKIITNNTTVDSLCNSIVFYNTGTTNVLVDGIKITPGTSFTFLGNENELNIKFYSIFFVVGGNPELTIIYKRYVES